MPRVQEVDLTFGALDEERMERNAICRQPLSPAGAGLALASTASAETGE